LEFFSIIFFGLLFYKVTYSFLICQITFDDVIFLIWTPPTPPSLWFFFCGDRGLNPEACIFYTLLSISTELNSRGEPSLWFVIPLLVSFFHKFWQKKLYYLPCNFMTSRIHLWYQILFDDAMFLILTIHIAIPFLISFIQQIQTYYLEIHCLWSKLERS